MMLCERCGKFITADAFVSHMMKEHRINDYCCSTCSQGFTSKRNLERHLKTIAHKRKLEECSEHQPISKRVRFVDQPYFNVQESESVFNGLLAAYRLTPKFQGVIDLASYLRDAKGHILDVLSERLDLSNGLKFLLSVCGEMVNSTDDEKTTKAHFNSNLQTVLQAGEELGEQLEVAFAKVIQSMEAFTREGSGWSIGQIPHIDIHVAEFTPVSGDSYIPLPKKLASKKAIVNVHNNDNKCFMWAILSALHPAERNPQRVAKYQQYSDQLNFDGITFPVTFSSIPKFETTNNISINVYTHDKGTGLALTYKSKMEHDHCVNLLLLQTYEKNHYCWIKDLDKMLFSQNKSNDRKHYCPRCVVNYQTEENLKKHVKLCQGDAVEQTVKMPENAILKFKNWHKSLRAPMVVYADFECYLQKIQQEHHKLEGKSWTRPVQEHKPCGYGFLTVKSCCDGVEPQISDPVIHRGEDSVEHFLKTAIDVSLEYQKQREQDSLKPKLNATEAREFRQSKECFICHEQIQEPCAECKFRKTKDRCKSCLDIAGWKARDHCHICGKFRGAAHSECNLKYRLNRDVVVVMHNLRRYDGHIIMQSLGAVANEYKGDIKCVPKGSEDYLMFQLSMPWKEKEAGKPAETFNLKFIDSFAFMSSSLEKLAGNLTPDDFNILSRAFPDPADQTILQQKGVYPYEYFDSMAKFDETQLPPKDQFFSSLRQETVSDGDYARAQEVWNHFSMKTLGDYHDLYLKTDVVLLADVFEKFRTTMLEHYNLDPAHYISLPSFTWDACLRKTGVELELFENEEMYEFCEQGIRGGTAMIATRYAKANNKYMADYNSEKLSNYIMYLDANNLYGWAMSQPLPMKEFEWVDEPEDYLNPPEGTGCIMEVDLEYPGELHYLHNGYPLAPEKLLVEDEMLSPYSLQQKQVLGVSSGKVEKLVPNFYNKSKYIVHYRNLRLYVELGMKVKAVHRVLKFREEAWMKPYILFNTEMRKLARNSFEKDLFKLMNNAVFGKTMENVRRYLKIVLATNRKKAQRYINRPTCCGFTIFSKNLVAIHCDTLEVSLNKPIYVGFAVLDLSKLLMYEFHYKYVMQRYGLNAQLLFTDTDSLCYSIKTEDVYKDMKEDIDYFDTSDYPKGHELQSDINKKVIGKFKDEANGKIIVEFVGLRAKMYSMLFEDEQEKKAAKGVSKTVITKELRHKLYVKALFEKTQMRHTMHNIRSTKHDLTTTQQRKVTLSCFDDKRYIVSEGHGYGIETLSYGHKDIP